MIAVPVANRAYRLRALGRRMEEAEERGHLAQATKFLEQTPRSVAIYTPPAVPVVQDLAESCYAYRD
ncbi:hypothetical protein [Pseudomonas syringae]|uniref:hypothetical protein n=1 Tax=Pseudomonas syringae TaxID=317 RepID=UPI000464A9EA|nr:hypothetical protein [Pseudomonas syringae]